MQFSQKLLSRSFFALLGSSVLIGLLYGTAHSQSTIGGFVYDKQRNAIAEIDVELMNDLYQTIRRTRTDGGGRYQFSGLNNGRFSVRVYAFRYDLIDQTQEIEINTQNIRGGQGSGYFLLDFYLLPRKGGIMEAELGVIFAQDVPPAAKKLYQKGVEDLAKNRASEGITALGEAVKAFPEYFAALQRIGKELYARQRYEEAAHFLFKAVEVNPKSATSFYFLGLSFLKLGKDYIKASATALNQAQLLAPAYPQVLWALGKAERANGNFNGAEDHLLKAKKLSNGEVAEIRKELAELYGNDLKRYGAAADELEAFIKLAKLSTEEQMNARKILAGLRDKAKTQ